MRTLFFLILIVLPVSLSAQYVGPPMTTVELGILDQTSKISQKKFKSDQVCTEDKSYCYEAIAIKDSVREQWMGEIVEFRVGNDYIPTDKDKVYEGIKITNNKNEVMQLMGKTSLKYFDFVPGNYTVPRSYETLFSSTGDYKFNNADIKLFETNRPKYKKYTIPHPKSKTLGLQDLSNFKSLYTQFYENQFIEIVQHKTHGTFKLKRYDLTKQITMQEIDLEFEGELHNIYSLTESSEHIAIHYFTKQHKAGTIVLYNNTEYNILGEPEKHTLALFKNGDYWYKIMTPKGEKTQLQRCKKLQGEYEKVKEITEVLSSYSYQPYYFNSANDTMKLGKSNSFMLFSDYSVFDEPKERINTLNLRDVELTVTADYNYGVNVKVVKDNITKMLYLSRIHFTKTFPMYKTGEKVLLFFNSSISVYDKRKDNFTYYALEEDRSHSYYNSFQVGKYYYSLNGGRLIYIDFSEIKLPL